MPLANPKPQQPLPKMSTTRLLLIRHGERADQVPGHSWNATRYGAPRPKDPPLTPAGREQAADVAQRVLQLAPTARIIYSSPLRRCLETAAEIAFRLDLPVKVVVPLAEPCRYFRKCAAEGRQPLFAAKEEATQILRSVHPTVRLVGFESAEESCKNNLERLCKMSMDEQKSETRAQTIVVGHCEAQKELAHEAGIPERIKTPFCGIALFELDHQRSTVGWNLVSRPLHQQHAPMLSASRNR